MWATRREYPPGVFGCAEEDGLASLDNPPYRDETAKGWGTRLCCLRECYGGTARLCWLGEDDAGALGGFVFYGLQGFVGLVEGEDLDLRLDSDFGG
jgi:hypothetical protein